MGTLTLTPTRQTLQPNINYNINIPIASDDKSSTMASWLLKEGEKANGRNGVFGTISNFKEVTKVPREALNWLAAFNKLSKGGENARTVFKIMPDILGIAGVMGSLAESYEELTVVADGSESAGARAKAFVESALAVNEAIADGAEFIQALSSARALKLSERTLEIIEWVGVPALTLASASGIVHDGIKIGEEVKDLKDKSLPEVLAKEAKARISHASLSLIKNIAYLALGIIGILGLALAIVCPIWVGLSLSTAAVAIGITTIVHDRLTAYKKRGSTQILPMVKDPVNVNIHNLRPLGGSAAANAPKDPKGPNGGSGATAESGDAKDSGSSGLDAAGGSDAVPDAIGFVKTLKTIKTIDLAKGAVGISDDAKGPDSPKASNGAQSAAAAAAAGALIMTASPSFVEGAQSQEVRSFKRDDSSSTAAASARTARFVQKHGDGIELGSGSASNGGAALIEPKSPGLWNSLKDIFSPSDKNGKKVDGDDSDTDDSQVGIIDDGAFDDQAHAG